MSGQRILVVEDQEDLAAIYQTVLQRAGYEVTVAYTGEEAIGEFEASGADLVLLDMTLPEMHGARALEKIRNLSASVSVIIVTGESGDELRAHCEQLGVNDFLSKPPDYDALLAAVKRALTITPEEYEVVTMRLPTRIVDFLSSIDLNLGLAVTRLCDESQNATPPSQLAAKKGVGSS